MPSESIGRTITETYISLSSTWSLAYANKSANDTDAGDVELRPAELNLPYTVFELLVALVAIIGNGMVIIVFRNERRLRRRTNYYIVSLALADFLVGLLGVPFAVLASVGLPTNLHACLFTVSLLVVLCTISIFCLVAVSVDRYWAILHPMAYSRNVRTKTAIMIITMCWVAGSIVGFLPLFGWHAGVSENQSCLFVEVMDYNYLVFLYFATIITPAIILAAFYAHIYRVIVKQVKLRQVVTINPVGQAASGSRRSSTLSRITITSRHYGGGNNRSTMGFGCSSGAGGGGTMLRVLGAAQKREVKATQNLSIIVLFFMICWFPLYTINCIKAFCPECFVPPIVTLFCIILSHLNSAVNPLLYAYHLKDFRAALKVLIMRLFGFHSQPQQQPSNMQQDLNFRASIGSQHYQQQQRYTSLLEKRSSLQPRIYIDSPIYLRSQQLKQQQQKLNVDKNSIKCSLNTINQTAIATIQQSAHINNNNIFQIPELPSTTSNTKEDSKVIYNTDEEVMKSSDLNSSNGDAGAVAGRPIADEDEYDDVFLKASQSMENFQIFTTELPFHVNENHSLQVANDRDNLSFNSFLDVTQDKARLCITQNCSSHSISNASLVDVEPENKYSDEGEYFNNTNISIIKVNEASVAGVRNSSSPVKMAREDSANAAPPTNRSKFFKILSSAKSDNESSNDAKSSPLKSVVNSDLFQIFDRHVVFKKMKPDHINRSHSHS